MSKVTITIHEPTHRDACINFGAATAEDAAAYDENAAAFFVHLEQTLRPLGVAVRLDTNSGSGRSYTVNAPDPDSEFEAHALMQQHGDFWAWYN